MKRRAVCGREVKCVVRANVVVAGEVALRRIAGGSCALPRRKE